MHRAFSNGDRLTVSKAKTNQLTGWQTGVALRQKAGVELSDIQREVASDRFQLSLEFNRQAKRLWKCQPAPYRSIISRHYYAMYHALRACAYLGTPGDDNEEHKKLPSSLPPSLPNSAAWGNALKNARETRNRADYDPYPKSNTAWKIDAEALKVSAISCLADAQSYLKAQGCIL